MAALGKVLRNPQIAIHAYKSKNNIITILKFRRIPYGLICRSIFLDNYYAFRAL